jgi:UDP-glucose 4-epimerase
MSRLLVTGGAGFIGSALVRELAADGHEIVVLDNLRRGHRERVEGLVRATGGRFIEGDIRDRDVLLEAARGCASVYHLAAQSNVMGAIDDPYYSFTTNVAGTFNVLSCAVELGVKRMVFTSSREVYGEPKCIPVDEEHALDARNPYGASKVAGEAYCRTFANCHGLDVAIVRLANVYGPGDSDRVIPLWLDAAMEGRDLTVYGGQQILDFVWIGTVVEALKKACADGLSGPTNIGSGTGTSILELGQRIIEITRTSGELVRVPARGAEVTRFVADVSRMREFGIEPEGDPLAHLPEMAEQALAASHA